MKRYQAILGAAVAIAVAGGCSSKPNAKPSDLYIPPEREQNEQILIMSLDQQSRAGAMASRTIYPHHFVAGGADLNVLGERQLDALATQGSGAPVEIHVPRGDAGDALYEQRLA